MRRRRIASGILIVAALVLPACEGSRRVEGDLVPVVSPGYRPVLKGEEANLWYHMDKAEKELKNSPFVIRDPELNRYLKDVVCRVVGDYCRDVRVYLVRTPYFNASMAPNGMMQIWSGLLLRVENEAQLAAVIGHELGHYVLQHSLQRFQDIKSKSNFAAFLRMGLAVAGAGYGASIADLILLASIYSFSREQEREADEFGLDVLVKTGYSPIEASRVWKRLIKERDAAEKKEEKDVFFSTHPAPEERAVTLEEMARKKARADGRYSAFRERLRAALDKHLPWLIADQLRLRQYGRTEALLDMMIEDGDDLGMLHFYKGELYRFRARKGDIEKALEAYGKAIAAEATPPQVYRSIGLVQQRRKNQAAANTAFLKYLELVPDAPDRLMIRSYVTPGS